MIKRLVGVTLAVTIVITCGFFAYSLSALAFYLLGILRIWRYPDVMAVGNVVVIICIVIGLVIGVVWARSILTSND